MSTNLRRSILGRSVLRLSKWCLGVGLKVRKRQVLHFVKVRSMLTLAQRRTTRQPTLRPSSGSRIYRLYE